VDLIITCVLQNGINGPRLLKITENVSILFLHSKFMYSNNKAALVPMGGKKGGREGEGSKPRDQRLAMISGQGDAAFFLICYSMELTPNIVVIFVNLNDIPSFATCLKR
jgi:hypothetical protein